MKESPTEVLSFRVPKDIAVKVNKIADEIPRGSASKVITDIFIPAFNRYEKRHEKKKAVIVAEAVG